MLPNQVEARLLKELSVKINRPWLEDCVNFFKQNDPRISFEELFNGAKEQLLLANYTDACLPVIPTAFRTRSDIWMMNENLFLQMQFVVDISEPFYEQWRKLHNIRLDDVQEVRESRAFQVKKKRCLKLTLTDGSQTIHAMEVRPITRLSTKLAPGIKVIIKGPVKVSNKIILLEADNIIIAGGEVDDLLIENAYENVLLKLLKRPITNTPVTNYVENQPETIEPSQITRHQPTAPINIKPPQNVNENLQKLSIDDDDDIDFALLDQIEAEELRKQQQQEEELEFEMLNQIAAEEMQNQHAAPVETVQLENNEIESNGKISESFLFELEQEIKNENVEKVQPLQKSTQLANERSHPIFSNPWNTSSTSSQHSTFAKSSFVDLFNKSKPEAPKPQKQVIKSPSPKKPSKLNELLIPSASLMNSMIIDSDEYMPMGEKRKSGEINSNEHPSKAPRLSTPPKYLKRKVTDEKYEYKIDYTYNFITIDQFNSLKTVEKLKRPFALQVHIEKVIRVRVHKEWILEVQLKDEWSTGSIDVKIENEIVAKEFAKHTAEEVMYLYQKIKEQPQLKENVTAIIDQVNEALQNNVFLFVVETKVIPPTTNQFMVTKMLKNTDDNKQVITLKIHDEDITKLLTD